METPSNSNLLSRKFMAKPVVPLKVSRVVLVEKTLMGEDIWMLVPITMSNTITPIVDQILTTK